MTKSDKITSINGKFYYRIFLAGANKILENQKILNQINVFPVPDADTGTNLASTCRFIIDNAKPDDSFQVTANAIAVAALNGARGNSGVIFAQFLYGMSVESGDQPHLTIHSFAEAIRKSVNYVYEAIANPVEGTMLTVIREWADFIYSQKDIIDDFSRLFSRAYEIAAEALTGTTEKLKALSLAHVVDAGAKGFVLFLEGILEGIRKRSSRRAIAASTKAIEEAPFKSISHEDFHFRYCTEAVIKGENIDKHLLKEELVSLGDSLVVAGSPQMIRLHIHTDQPPLLFEKLEKYGAITFQKADDMKKQNEVVTGRKWSIALVTDSTCDLPEELNDYYQIQQVPLNIHFGETQYIDKVTLQPGRFFSLAEDSPEFPSTSQPNESAFLSMFSHLASHYDSVIAVHLSGKFSGTLRNSRNAAERISKEMNKKISVLDSGHVSGSLGLLTLRVARAIEKGMDHDAIVQRFPDWKANTQVYVSVKTLKYLVRGGRVSPLKGQIAKILNIKPIVTMRPDGTTELSDKAFSQRANMRKVMRQIRKFNEKKPISEYILLHAHDEDATHWFRKEMKEVTGTDPLAVLNISPVIGLHAGKGAAAVAITSE